MFKQLVKLFLFLAFFAIVIYATVQPQLATAPSRSTGPSGQIQDIFASVFGSDRIIESLSATPSSIEIHFPLTNLSADLAAWEGNYRFAKFACALRAAGFTAHTYRFAGSIQLVDAYGNTRTATGVMMYLSRDTISRLNCSNVDFIDLSRVADQYDVNEALR